MSLASTKEKCSSSLKEKLSRINGCSSGRKLILKKPENIPNTEESKNETKDSRKTRSPLYLSNSFCQSGVVPQAKKEPKSIASRIPRSKSRNRSLEPDKSKTEDSASSNLSVEKTSSNEKNNENKIDVKLLKNEKCVAFSPSISENIADNGSHEISDAENISLSMKSCEEFPNGNVPQNHSEVSYKETQEGLDEQEWTRKYDCELFCSINDGNDAMKEIKEANKQDKTIQSLYETLSGAKESIFENLKCSFGKNMKIECKNSRGENLTNFNLQNCYGNTLKEIEDIWMNALSLIHSVKDHMQKFFEDESKTIDKEQLFLEAEMLQLSVDFSINFSKIKMDFLIEKLKKQLNVTEVEKTELENFMDSKTVAAVYNDEDLAGMAQTVKELNSSLLKGNEFELE